VSAFELFATAEELRVQLVSQSSFNSDSCPVQFCSVRQDSRGAEC